MKVLIKLNSFLEAFNKWYDKLFYESILVKTNKVIEEDRVNYESLVDSIKIKLSDININEPSHLKFEKEIYEATIEDEIYIKNKNYLTDYCKIIVDSNNNLIKGYYRYRRLYNYLGADSYIEVYKCKEVFDEEVIKGIKTCDLFRIGKDSKYELKDLGDNVYYINIDNIKVDIDKVSHINFCIEDLISLFPYSIDIKSKQGNNVKNMAFKKPIKCYVNSLGQIRACDPMDEIMINYVYRGTFNYIPIKIKSKNKLHILQYKEKFNLDLNSINMLLSSNNNIYKYINKLYPAHKDKLFIFDKSKGKIYFYDFLRCEIVENKNRFKKYPLINNKGEYNLGIVDLLR